MYEVIRTYIVEGRLDYSNLYPSFPTGGIIINKKDIHTIYETGKGKVVVRAKAEIKDNNILITEIPYQVYVEPLIEQIKKLAVDGIIEGIYDIHNKSDKKKLLIEIVCDGNPTTVLNKLFKNSDLEKSYSANQYALVGKTPKLLNLKQYLDIYLNHNYECIRKENEFELEKAANRLEIVDGLIKALEDIDNIIALIKASNSSKDAVINLINKYKFTNNQAKAIVDMKLGRLAHLEKIELNEEKEGLTSTIKNCEDIIKNISKQKEIFMGRLANFINKYPCYRKTDVTQIDISSQEKEIVYVEPEKCIVVTTESGLIKRIPIASFKTQRRNGKGVKTDDDIVNCVIRTNTIDSLMVFTNKGTMYRVLVDNIPVGTNTSKGVPIKSLIEMLPGEEPTLIYSIYRNTEAKYVLFTTKNGLVKKTALEEYVKTKKKTGVAAITIKENDSLANVCLVNEEPIIIVTKNGYAIEFDSKEISCSGRTTMGMKGINLSEGDEVITTLPIHNVDDSLAIFSEHGLGKKVSQNERVRQKRGGKGLIYYKPTDVSGKVSDATLIEDEDNILIIGAKNSICINAKEISTLGRASLGNGLIKGDIKKVSKI